MIASDQLSIQLYLSRRQNLLDPFFDLARPAMGTLSVIALTKRKRVDRFLN